MYQTEKGNKFQNYLENLIGNELEGKIQIWEHKSKIDVEDVDIFHKIAKEQKIDEISKINEGLNYIEEVGGNYWSICLSDRLNKSFVDKYGEKYNKK